MILPQKVYLGRNKIKAYLLKLWKRARGEVDFELVMTCDKLIKMVNFLDLFYDLFVFFLFLLVSHYINVLFCFSKYGTDLSQGTLGARTNS